MAGESGLRAMATQHIGSQGSQGSQWHTACRVSTVVNAFGGSLDFCIEGKHVKSLRVMITVSATRGHPGCWNCWGRQFVLLSAAIEGVAAAVRNAHSMVVLGPIQ